MKQGDKFKLNITDLGTNGEGVGRYLDYTVFVPFALPSEVVEVVAMHIKRNIIYAKLENIETASGCRVDAPCKYFQKCGGCQLQHLSYPQQLLHKQNLVKNNLRKIGNINYDVLETVPSDKIYGYRNKISLPIGGKVGDIKIGMYRENSHEIIDIDNCLLTEEWATILMEKIRQYANFNGIKPYNETDFSGEFRHAVARRIDDRCLISIVTNGAYKGNFEALVASLQKSFSNFGLYNNVNNNKNNVIVGEKNLHIFGLKEIESSFGGIKFSLQPNSFFQVNDSVKNKLYRKVKDLLNSSEIEVLIDCFSGVGVLTAALYSDNYQTYAIEIITDAVADANKMKEQNNLQNLTNICGDANIELPKLIEQTKGKKTAMVVDPPRKGLGEKICNTILSSPPSQLIYISCDSATLARDLKALTSIYEIAHIEPYDMFPQTKHVETLVCLKLKNT